MDVLPLGRDQRRPDVCRNRGGLEPISSVAGQPPNPVSVTSPQPRQNLRCDLALSRELIELALRNGQRLRACGQLGLVLALTLVRAVARQSQPPGDARQQQSLPDQRDQDDTERDRENEIAVRKWRAGCRGGHRQLDWLWSRQGTRRPV